VFWTLLDILEWFFLDLTVDKLFVRIEPTGTMPKPLTTNNVGVTNLKDTVAAALVYYVTYGKDINNALRIHNVDSE
ncbi:12266_t:CDS:2, partial [Funneliformis caledonium]